MMFPRYTWVNGSDMLHKVVIMSLLPLYSEQYMACASQELVRKYKRLADGLSPSSPVLNG